MPRLKNFVLVLVWCAPSLRSAPRCASWASLSKKDTPGGGTGPRGRGATAGGVGSPPRRDRSPSPDLHRRDVGQDQHDAIARQIAQGRAARGQGSARTLED